MGTLEMPAPDKRFETRHAPEILELLETATKAGSAYVVFELRPTGAQLQPADLVFYDDMCKALDDWEFKAPGGDVSDDADHTVCFWETDKMGYEIRLANTEEQHKNFKLPVPHLTAPKPCGRKKGRRI